MHALTDTLEKQESIQDTSHNINLGKKAFDVDVNWKKAARLGINQRRIADALRVFSRETSLKWYKDGIGYEAFVQLFNRHGI